MVRAAWNRVVDGEEGALEALLSDGNADRFENEEEYHAVMRGTAKPTIRNFLKEQSLLLQGQYQGYTFGYRCCGVCEYDGHGEKELFASVRDIIRHAKSNSTAGKRHLHRAYAKKLREIFASSPGTAPDWYVPLWEHFYR